ncbi:MULTISPECIES: lantibiotic dehydratase [unclassified Streptomyces]|uniref:lantibiotic dehydratase n=1 Tax=unclassified Streptomyces TaxID=2593676 RepID=UPI003825366E
MTESPLSPWLPLPAMVVRSAGFPASWLTELHSGETVAAQHRKDDAAVRAAYDAEVVQTSAAVVRRFHEEPKLRDAVQFANPALWQRLGPWVDRRVSTPDGWRSADRQRTDLLTRMLQRYCAKNETTSHAGPITTAFLRADQAGVTCAPGLPRRHVRLSHWAAERLQVSFLTGAVAAHHWWRPRATAGCYVSDGELSVVTYDFTQRHHRFSDAVIDAASHRLSQDEARVLRWCDGSRSVAGIRHQYEREYGTPLAEAAAVRVLRSLEDYGAVMTGPELPYGVHDAIPLLRQLTAEVGDQKAERHVEAVESALAALESAADERGRAAAAIAVQTAYTTATGQSPYRAAGVTNGDRTVFNEDCDSEYGVMALGRPIPDLVARELAFVYDIFLVLPRARLNASRRMMRAWFGGVFGAGASVPVADFVTACLRDDAQLSAGFDAIDSEMSAKAAHLKDLLTPAERTAREHHITEEAIANARALAGDPLPAVCNPDLMLAADGPDAVARGDFLAVVGDLHAAEEGLSHSLFAPWVDAAVGEGTLGERVAAAYRPLLEPDEDLADVTHRHRSKTYARADLPCLDIEAADRSPLPARSRVRLHELIVNDTARGLRLHLPGSDRALRLTSPPLYWQGVRARNPFAVFSFPQRVDGLPVPLEDEGYLPRLVHGRVVLQRAMWGLSAAACHGKDWYAGFRAVQRLREEHGLPRHVFVKFPQEVKPLYCDLDSPLLVRQVSRMAKAAGDGRLVVSEMLPGPGSLWLTSTLGKVTSELRYAVFSSGGTHGPQGPRPGGAGQE